MPSLAGTIAVKTCMAPSMEWGNQATQKAHRIKNFCSRCEGEVFNYLLCGIFFISDFVAECVKPGRGVSWPPHYHISPRCAETETFSIFLWCSETLSWYPCIAGLDGISCKFIMFDSEAWQCSDSHIWILNPTLIKWSLQSRYIALKSKDIPMLQHSVKDCDHLSQCKRGHTFPLPYRFHWQILMQKSCLLWRLAGAAMSAQDYAKTWIRAALSGLKYVSEDNDVNSHSGGEIIHYPHPLVRITLEILWRLFWAQTMRPCALPVICRCVPITNNQSKVALWSQILEGCWLGSRAPSEGSRRFHNHEEGPC